MKSIAFAALGLVLLAACAPRAEKTVAAIDPEAPPAAASLAAVAGPQPRSLDEMLTAARVRFGQADLNKDGKVTTEEIEQVRSERDDAGPRRGGDGRLMRADTDIDGEVTLADVEARARKRFAALDIDGDGAVTAQEMRPAT